MTVNDANRIARLHQIFDEPLSEQQKDVALMYSIGLTIDVIADIKGIKPPTVREHLDKARGAFGGVGVSTLRAIILLRIIILVGFNQNTN